MPRVAKAPRLWLRSRSGRASQWVILDRGKEFGTGCGAGDRRGAEETLAAYIRQKYEPQSKGGRLSGILIADVVLCYLREHAPHVARPDYLAGTARPVIEWWVLKTLLYHHPLRGFHVAQSSSLPATSK